MEMKKALVTGITGQDGSYLAEYLLGLGYEVHGMIRRASTDNHERINHIKDNPNLHLHYGELGDQSSLDSLVAKTMPDEVYNLAAQSHVGTSFKIPEETGNVSGLGTLRLLESLRRLNPNGKFYQASTSELFGKGVPPYDEKSPMYPRSPYGVAKLYSYWITVNYRESYDMFACNGILFNHESPRRGDNFVTQKVVKHLIGVWKREREHLEIGNMDARRDWGYAGDYVKGMHAMLQADKPEDFILATGISYSVRDLIETTASLLGMDLEWKDKGLKEHGIDKKTGKTVVVVNPDFYRPAEVEMLVGNAGKAAKILNWTPETSFNDLVKMMVDSHL